MSEYQFPHITHISVKEIQDDYPQPKCDPKKVITLPPAAADHEMGIPASIKYRHYSKTPHEVPQESPPSERAHEYDTTSSSRSKRVHSSSLPYSRSSSGSSPPAPRTTLSPAATAPPASRSRPHSRVKTTPPSPARKPSAPYSQSSSGRSNEQPRVPSAGGDPSSRSAYGAPQAVRGSTIPRQPQMNSICSPAARNARGGSYGLAKPVRAPTKH